MDIKQKKIKPLTEAQLAKIVTTRKTCIQKYRNKIQKTAKKRVKFDTSLVEKREIPVSTELSQEVSSQKGPKAVKEPKAKKEPKAVKEPKAKKEPKVKEPKVKEPKAKKEPKVKEPKAKKELAKIDII